MPPASTLRWAKQRLAKSSVGTNLVRAWGCRRVWVRTKDYIELEEQYLLETYATILAEVEETYATAVVPDAPARSPRKPKKGKKGKSAP